MDSQRYFVYFMTNISRSVLYVGVTNDVWKRAEQHRAGVIPGFTAKYRLKYLLYFEEFDRIHDALQREKQIKGWSRSKKEALINPRNPSWDDIAEHLSRMM